MKSYGKRIAPLAVWISLVGSPATAEKPRENSAYVVLAADETTVEALEARYPELAGRWSEIAKFNLLRSGHAIEVPASLLTTDGVLAKIASFYGEAEVRRSFEDRFVPVAENLLVREGDEIRTWRGSGVRILFDDGNYVFLKSHSRARVVSLGDEPAAAAAPRLRLDLEEGGLWSEIASPIRGRYEIRTRTASTIIRGTSFRVKVEPSEATRVEVLDGRVEVEVGDQRLSVGTREGALAASSDAAPVTELLPAAPLPGAPLPEEVMARESFDQTFRWAPSPEAASYLLEIARDDTFFDIVVERRVTETSLPVRTLDSGTYFWRVSSISANGFQGVPSEPRYFVFVQRRP